ncbi:TetR/AcrR family transcriptional regulator [Actinacidiphila sp. ITFR-21]|uniref:TetR/AcrR family transcriptional regulator n=1 Tax=Actinacidiphila sp. ITFR-21 TaxID=3075199 RepID=UPI00288BB612|nr:helix-turn-helix domain-containing protein [Streptomyces sp. ITFR-21]WNI14226.1 helix-turn-helix domain-containing protein [Streptomyces sp. ITFR-21]
MAPEQTPRPERADAARNRRILLATAREMLAALGADRLTMDALAERSGLGKGTVFRRFSTRAGIFRALLDEDERVFQERVLSGPPPLGPGAGPVERLVAYGRARAAYLMEHREIARAALDGRQQVPAGAQTPLNQIHLRMLLGRMDIGPANLDVLAVQLSAALDGPFLLYLSAADLGHAASEIERRMADSWEDLVLRVCRPRPPTRGGGPSER